MTSFASWAAETDSYTIIWEVRPVNHRYLYVSSHFPEPFRAIEPLVRDAVSKHVKPCKIEYNLSYQKDKKVTQDLENNEDR